MPLDAICLSALAAELSSELSGGRIDKIQQPERDELIIAFRGQRGAARLLISANPSRARVHLTTLAKENPAAPPMFCMLLRKHITGAKILGLCQPELERVLELRLLCTDELGQSAEKRLVLELMGRHSNIVLVGPDDRIIDCLKKVDSEMSERRPVLPGLFYRLPPGQDKKSPALPLFELCGLMSAAPQDIPAEKWLLDTFYGLSPLVCRELVYRCAGDAEAKLAALGDTRREKLAYMLTSILPGATDSRAAPYIITDVKTGKPADFSFMEMTHQGTLRSSRLCRSFSEMLDEFHTRRDNAERITQRSSELLRVIANAHARISRKLAAQRLELLDTASRERLRELGDILGAAPEGSRKGLSLITLEDFYAEPGMTAEIKLDPRLSLAQNAQKYYRDYARMKSAETALTKQITSGEAELLYLDSVLDELARAQTQRDIDEIRSELAEGGYIPVPKAQKRSARRDAGLPPRRYRTSDGFTVLAGRNNRHNDLLTLKTASRFDYWFHTQKIPGSHVILVTEGKIPSERAMTEAASIAALHSKAAASEKVPVDYTLVKNVKKPPGAKPGMVIYSDFKTAFVTPDEKMLAVLEIKTGGAKE